LGLGEQSTSLLLLSIEPLLPTGQDLIGHQALVRQLADRPLVSLDVALDDSHALIGVGLDVGPHRVLRLLREPDGPVVLLDRALDERCWIVRREAAGCRGAALAVDAREVLVGPTVAGVPGVEQSSSAGCTGQAAAQVVLVLGRPVSGLRPGGQLSLDAVEGVAINERIVPAHDPSPGVLHNANVVDVW
jgi:hypothetical protein